MSERIAGEWHYVIEPKAGSDGHIYVVDFSVYEIVGREMPSGAPVYLAEGAVLGTDNVKSINGAQRYAHGSVKWDGCSNWFFDEQDRCMLHFCALPNLGAMMTELYQFCAEQMPDADVAEYAKDDE